jgi:hypothetical protein
MYLGRGLATSWSLVQGVLPSVKWSWNWKNQRPGPKEAVVPAKKKVFSGSKYGMRDVSLNHRDINYSGIKKSSYPIDVSERVSGAWNCSSEFSYC